MARPRKDVMKAEKIDISQKPKPEGGMAHSMVKEEKKWGDKIPPFPRSVLNQNKNTIRSGMALIRE